MTEAETRVKQGLEETGRLHFDRGLADRQAAMENRAVVLEQAIERGNPAEMRIILDELEAHLSPYTVLYEKQRHYLEVFVPGIIAQLRAELELDKEPQRTVFVEPMLPDTGTKKRSKQRRETMKPAERVEVVDQPAGARIIEESRPSERVEAVDVVYPEEDVPSTPVNPLDPKIEASGPVRGNSVVVEPAAVEQVVTAGEPRTLHEAWDEMWRGVGRFIDYVDMKMQAWYDRHFHREMEAT